MGICKCKCFVVIGMEWAKSSRTNSWVQVRREGRLGETGRGRTWEISGVKTKKEKKCVL